jgi:hypothetical protein
LAVGILLRFGAHVGQYRYQARYDPNGDGVIDANNLLMLLNTPVCHGGGDHGDPGSHDDGGRDDHGRGRD